MSRYLSGLFRPLNFTWSFLALLTLVAFVSCTKSKELGSEANPIKICLVPGQDTHILEENGKALEAFLQKDVGLNFQLTVPQNFVAVVEALGSKRADVAFMNTFGFLLASEKYQAEARLIGINKGRDEYSGQIIARVNGPKSLKDLNGKRFAFVDPASGSGFILPSKLLQDKKIKLKEYVFAGRHDSVVSMVYQGRVDAGATYHTPPEDGVPQDARKIVLAQYPDIFEKVKIIEMTETIPNDPVVFRKDFPIEWREKIVASLKKYIKTDEGKKVLYNLYHMTDLRDVKADDYSKVRKMLLDMGKKASELVK